MKFKQIVSSILAISTLTFALPLKKAQAGIVISASSAAVVAARFNSSNGTGLIPVLGLPVGVLTILAGSIVMFFNPIVGGVLIVLSEDGSLPQSDLEQVLAQKYSFIQDPMVIADLASMIKQKSEHVTPVDGKILVSLSEAEIKSAFESTDLFETHSVEIASLIKELK